MGDRSLVGLTAVFRCAVCGKPAATVSTTEADEPVAIVSPSKATAMSAPGLLVRGFGGDMWRRLTREAFVTARAKLDAATLVALDPRLARFHCRTCDLDYCWTHWYPMPIDDEAGYDGMTGTCPKGHEQTIDD